MRVEIKTLHQEFGTTTLYVTHDQIEALSLGTAIAVMRSGKVEQYATPQEIYHDPKTLFVARFVGSPSMNLLPVTVQHSKNHRVLAGKGFSLSLSGELARAVPAISAGTEIIVGVRPEHLSVEAPGIAGVLDGTIRIVEPLGQDQYIHVAVGQETVITRVDPDRVVAVGESVGLRPSPRSICFFDPITEKRIR
jgi:multiple sugar transport system ATP-binding protein